MSILTRSKFYYGHTVDDSNNVIQFNEGAEDLNAIIPVGSYSLEDYASAVASAMSSASLLPQDYAATVDRSTRQITIASAANFSLLVSSGGTGASAYPLIGFTLLDQTGSNSYQGDSSSGQEYIPRFRLQRYTPFEYFKSPAFASINKAASGITEVVSFGDENFAEFELQYITNIEQGKGGPLENSATAVEEAVAFLEDITKKNIFEFIPDRDSPGNYEKVILDSSSENQDGVGFKLVEYTNINLPRYYRSGLLKLRRL